ncbi:hypothetical protein FE236_08075 [Mariprofundus erugo]|uniref:Uncharacterized protein n=1 Tax=Mariprofundus erugo TaxID=2528639 RepID=A0A5R9GTM0_9PROT|nr:hypothetical protein [Mariprofundus erugo]TLS67813.1 hypothetical protein FEF65_05015 [Mariprofundus erugo]TLS75935.1 hypothetical protein FE236_08075 [Mariprofundus erugo]
MNHIEVSIEFYFRGCCLTPTAVINLDECMRHEEPLEYIYKMLAAENGIGSYSHEFDVMVMEALSFHHASGLASRYLHDGHFDFDGFREAWLEESVVRVLQPIAEKYLGVSNLEEHPSLKRALIEAYQANPHARR